jgi:HD-like signal output (HDOD) protein
LEIGETIAGDPAISAKILQLVNSAFFGVGRKVSSVGEAATLLGLDAIKQLVLSVELFSQFDEQKLNCAGFLLDELVEHSIRVGLLAKQIAMAEHADKTAIEESYLSGFLHDVGKLILVDNMPEEYKEVVGVMQAEQMETHAAERKVLGTDHGAVGAYLLGLWGFSDAVLESVAFHHSPNKIEAMKFAPLTAIHVENVLDNASAENNTDPELDRLDTAYLAKLNIEGRLLVWKSLCKQAEKE